MVPVETNLIGGIRTIRASRAQLAEMMISDVRAAERGGLRLPRIITSSNGFTISLYHRSREFRTLIDQADVVDADGMPVILASRMLNAKPLIERVATTDFIHDASKAAARAGVHFFFLGAKPGIAEQAAANLRAAHPGLEIVGVRNGYFARNEEPAILEEVRASGAKVLWVGLGSPRQEAFAARNRAALAGLAWIRTCGGLFDHVVGAIPRAPDWMQRVGLEWLYRMAREPSRLGMRYLFTNPQAVYHLLTKTRG